MNVDISELKEFRNKLQRFKSSTPQYNARFLELLGEKIKKEIVSLNRGIGYGQHPYAAGFLLSSWYVKPAEVSGREASVELGNTAEYSSFWEFGFTHFSGRRFEGTYMLTSSTNHHLSAFVMPDEYKGFITKMWEAA